MKQDTHDRLLRLIQGDLSAEEVAQLRAEVERSPALRAELDELRALHGLLRTTVQASADDALQPFFADRLMRRLRPAPHRLAAPDEAFFEALLAWFRPVALAGLLLLFGLITYNVTLSNEYEAEPSTTEAVLALPPVTLATAYDVDY